jgi:hypothetical protein
MLVKSDFETYTYLKFGFDYNDTDQLLTFIQDGVSENIEIEYVEYSGPKIVEPVKALPR